MIKQCCQCGKIEADGLWVDSSAPAGPVSHGYCPPCLADALESVDLLQESEMAGEEVAA